MEGGLGGLWNKGTSIKISSKIQRKQVTQGSILKFSLLDTFKTTFLMQNRFFDGDYLDFQ